MNAATVRPLRIDSHQHFWRYTPEEFSWIDEGMKAIRRDFLPSDLKREITGAGIDGVISVQACQSIEETEWLLDLADENEFIFAVVGWAPLLDPNVPEALDKLAARPKLRGIRHIVQGEPKGFLLRDDFNAGIKALEGFHLTYDLLILERQLPEAIEFVDRHPNQVFILDHIAKPRIRDRVLSPWQEDLLELSKRRNVYCKLSGVVTEADYRSWTQEELQPYLEVALSAFGPSRLMFGSDWPVSQVAASYARWFDIVCCFVATLSPDEQRRVLGLTALEAYRIPLPPGRPQSSPQQPVDSHDSL